MPLSQPSFATCAIARRLMQKKACSHRLRRHRTAIDRVLQLQLQYPIIFFQNRWLQLPFRFVRELMVWAFCFRVISPLQLPYQFPRELTRKLLRTLGFAVVPATVTSRENYGGSCNSRLPRKVLPQLRVPGLVKTDAGGFSRVGCCPGPSLMLIMRQLPLLTDTPRHLPLRLHSLPKGRLLPTCAAQARIGRVGHPPRQRFRVP